MSREQMEDILERAAATFWQGALAAAPLTVVTDWSGIKVAVTAMLIGGGAAVLSGIKGIVRAKRTVQ